MKNIQSQLIIIDSKDRNITDISSPSDFTYAMTGYSPSSVIGYRINSVSIPYSWYPVITQAFEITYNAVNYTVNIFGGAYNAFQMANAMQLGLNVAVGSGKITCVFATDGSATFVIQCVNPADHLILRFDVNNLDPLLYYKSVGIQMGFRTPLNVDTPDLTSFYFFTSQYAVNLTSGPNIYIESQALQLYISSFMNQTYSSVVQAIPVNVNPGEFISWQNTYPVNFTQDGKKSYNNFDFKLIDEYGTVIDLRGLDWSLVIEMFYNF